MHCRNCNYDMDPLAAYCVKCGVPAGKGDKYCPNCGEPTPIGATICIHCGYALNNQQQYYSNNGPYAYPERKSRLVAGILGIVLGALGVHNFYLGYTSRGMVQILLSVLSCGILSWVSAIWGLIEGIMILTGSTVTDAAGVPLRD